MWTDDYIVNKTPSRIAESHESEAPSVNEDPLEDIKERLEHKFHYRPEEQGIFHTTKHQGLKLRNNGSAELFTDEDTGIRLDPISQSINMFANHYKEHIHDKTSWLTGSATHYIKEHWTVKTKGKNITIAEDNIEITTKKNRVITIDQNDIVTIKGDMTLHVLGNVSAAIGGSASLQVEGDVSSQIDGNLNAKVGRHATIDVANDLTIHSDRNISLTSDGYVHIDGRELYIGMSPR